MDDARARLQPARSEVPAPPNKAADVGIVRKPLLFSPNFSTAYATKLLDMVKVLWNEELKPYRGAMQMSTECKEQSWLFQAHGSLPARGLVWAGAATLASRACLRGGAADPKARVQHRPPSGAGASLCLAT
jgi:hypothetical protein